MAPSPEPEKAVTMLYVGVSGAIGGVGGVDTDGNFYTAGPKRMMGMLQGSGFGEGTQLRIPSLK